MTESTQVADNADARNASMSRVVTHETLMASLQPEKPASEAESEKAPEVKPEGEEKPKAKTAQERVLQALKRKEEAEAKAEAATREAAELRARVEALEASKSVQIEQSDKPQRHQFATDEEFIEAVADWRADQRIAERERQKQEAQLKAEAEAIDTAFITKVKKAAAEIEDFEEVVSAATVNIPDFLVMAIKESDSGPLLTYYLAKNQDEARRIAAMRPIQAIKALDKIERDLMADEPESKPEVSTPKTKRAPDPITPVRGASTPNPGPAKSFDEYKARRIAEQRK